VSLRRVRCQLCREKLVYVVGGSVMTADLLMDEQAKRARQVEHECLRFAPRKPAKPAHADRRGLDERGIMVSARSNTAERDRR